MNQNQILFTLVTIGFVLVASNAFAQASCGNHSCESPTENSCTCPSDCGSCTAKIDPAYTYSCDGENKSICTQHPKNGVCGNGVCEATYNEDYGTCPADCEATILDIEIVSPTPSDSFARNQRGTIRIKITADGRDIIGAQVSATYPYRNMSLQNKPFSNEYFATFQIPGDANTGTFESRLTASFRKITKETTFPLTIDAKLNGTLLADDETVLGNFVTIHGQIKNGDEAVQISVHLAIENKNHTALFSKDLQTDPNGEYTVSFKTSQNDADGTYTIKIQGKDAFDNTLSLSKSIQLVKTSTQHTLTVELTSLDQNTASRGEKITLFARVRDRTIPLSDARLEIQDPKGRTTAFGPSLDTNYSLVYTIPADLGFGPQSFIVHAQTIQPSLEGTTKFQLILVPSRFSVEILKPQSNLFAIGDNIEFQVYAQYDSGEPVLDANVSALLGQYEIPLNAQGGGYYGTTYQVQEQQKSQTDIKVVATDAYGQTASTKTKLNTFGYGLNYYISNFGAIVAALLIALVALIGVTRHYAQHASSEKTLNTRTQQLIELEKELQIQYFEKAAIEKSDYEKQMIEYEDEMKRINEKLGKRK
ncbi:MAG: hypothetical protein Q7R47_00985 [Candidatus Diapherotrites archaeon]|nr:hypothetical protein [Candidatus Diapherotrites archaeon]